MYTYRSVILFVLAWPLTGLGLAVAEGGTREALALLVVSGALLAAAGLTILRDPADIANNVEWEWSSVGQGRQAGLFIGVLLALFGAGMSIYGIVGATEAFAGR